LVRDLARNMKKEINLELVGEETDLDKNLVEALGASRRDHEHGRRAGAGA
ncbi:hypothetical protein H7972_28805, partial [Pseudomonas aeruginosa]|nr:hypothetical protein [Pseudomonas aeruginosa]